MYGLVYKYDGSKGTKVDPAVSLNKVNDIETEYEQLWGNWQSYLQNKDGPIWDLDQTIDSSTQDSKQLKQILTSTGHGKVIQAKNLATPNCLPSDCRNREDVIWIRQGSTAHAEQWKQYLEEQQRKEEKLRKEAKKK